MCLTSQLKAAQMMTEEAQYIQVDIIFNYNFHFELPGHVFIYVPQTHLSGAGFRKVHFPNFKDMFMEVQMKHVV